MQNGWQGPANHFCTAKTRTIGERCGILDMNPKQGSRTDDLTQFNASVSTIGGRGSLSGRTNTILGDPEADRGAGRKLGRAVSLFFFSPSPSVVIFRSRQFSCPAHDLPLGLRGWTNTKDKSMVITHRLPSECRYIADSSSTWKPPSIEVGMRNHCRRGRGLENQSNE